MKYLLLLLCAVALVFASNGSDPKDDINMCEACEMMIGAVERFLSSNESMRTMERKAIELCGRLPTSIRSECRKMAHDYLPQFMNWVNLELTPQKICGELPVCLNHHRDEPIIELVDDFDPNDEGDGLHGKVCAICEVVCQIAENYISANKTEEEIMQSLDMICQEMPSSYSSQCEMMVKVYGPRVINFIVHKENPATLCAQLHLCPPDDNVLQRAKSHGKRI